MLDSYFFIPADKEKYINNISKIQADYFILDLEDAVSVNNKQLAYHNTINFLQTSNTFIRIPFFDKVYTKKQLHELIKVCQGRVIVPKVKQAKDINNIISLVPEMKRLQLILLVESPLCYINISEVLEKHTKHIYGVGFGSHDFCTAMNMKHQLKNLAHFKKELIVLTKAYQKKFIDTVDINLTNFTEFREDCIFAFENGADGKFLIHPMQLEEMKKVAYLSENEILKINKIYKHIEKIDLNSIDIIIIENEIYEKPHIQRLITLYNKLNP